MNICPTNYEYLWTRHGFELGWGFPPQNEKTPYGKLLVKVQNLSIEILVQKSNFGEKKLASSKFAVSSRNNLLRNSSNFYRLKPGCCSSPEFGCTFFTPVFLYTKNFAFFTPIFFQKIFFKISKFGVITCKKFLM